MRKGSCKTAGISAGGYWRQVNVVRSQTRAILVNGLACRLSCSGWLVVKKLVL